MVKSQIFCLKILPFPPKSLIRMKHMNFVIVYYDESTLHQNTMYILDSINTQLRKAVLLGYTGIDC